MPWWAWTHDATSAPLASQAGGFGTAMFTERATTANVMAPAPAMRFQGVACVQISGVSVRVIYSPQWSCSHCRLAPATYSLHDPYVKSRTTRPYDSPTRKQHA